MESKLIMTYDFLKTEIPKLPPDIKRPLWSVIIPAYNPGKFLYDALDSVTSQYSDKEKMDICVVDDCSDKVDIYEFIKKYGNERVRVYRNPFNLGHSKNYTNCVKNAKGKLIHFLHQDDKVKAGFYKKFEEIFEKYPEAGAAFCRQEYINEKNEFLFNSAIEQEDTGPLDNALIKLAETQKVQYCSMVVKRGTYETVGGFMDRNIGCEDWEMWVRIASKFEIIYEPEALAVYRIHSKSMTGKDMKSGKDMRDLREAISIFSQYIPAEKRIDVRNVTRKHYSNYSFENAKKLKEQFNDEASSAAQLSEAIRLNSGIVSANQEFISGFNTKIDALGVSVIIHANNDEEIIERTLRHLIIQRVPKYLPWEVILIDNNSDDNTAEKALDTWKKYNGKVPLKIIRTNLQYASEVFRSGIKNSNYDFILICNPGNLLDGDYLYNASKGLLSEMDAGAIGGYAASSDKNRFPAWFDNSLFECLETGEQFQYPGYITWTRGYLWNSGLTFRKEAIEALSDFNFKSKADSSDIPLSFRTITTELCYAMRLTGWSIKYDLGLKLKQLYKPDSLNWNRIRSIRRQDGTNSAILYSLEKSNQNRLADFSKIKEIKPSRKSVIAILKSLKKFPLWKLTSYSESHQGDMQFMEIEFLLGKLRILLNRFKTYNNKARFLRRYSYKKHLKFLKYSLSDPYFRFPQYKKSNDKRGVSVFLQYENNSPVHLLKAIEHVASQRLPKGFKWELNIAASFLKDDIKKRIFDTWNTSGCKSRLHIIEQVNSQDMLLKAASYCEYSSIVFINEFDFLDKNYLRIAYKVLRENKSAGLAGGRTTLSSDVKPPKWFSNYEEYYGIGKQAESSGDITYSKGYLWKDGLVARKKALFEFAKKSDDAFSVLLPNSSTSDLDLSAKMILAGWRIVYQERLILAKFIPVQNFNWEYLRKLSNEKGREEVREQELSDIIRKNNGGNGSRSWVFKANQTIGTISRYPLKKIFAKNDEFRNDAEVLEIERLKGKFTELINSKDNHYRDLEKLNGKLHKNGKISSGVNGVQTKSTNPPGVSILICCYNSAAHLPSTLKYLYRQNVPLNIPWEVIIVDNNSTDNTAEIARREWDKHNCLAPLRIVKETTPGLSAARLRGYKEAKYEYLVLCDDDNWLQKDFVRIVYEMMNGNEKIGAAGGQSIAEFETIEPVWFNTWRNSYAVGKQFSKAGDITQSRGYVWGAGMIIRKSAWKKLLAGGFNSLLTDRLANTLTAGGDTELCYALRNAGWEIRYEPRLKFRHYITKERLDWNYLRRMFKGFGRASIILDQYSKRNGLSSVSKKRRRKSARHELGLVLKKLREIRYYKLLSYDKKREGDTDLPMIEYSAGRLISILKQHKTYNRGLHFLKRSASKNDLRHLSSVLKSGYSGFPKYKIEKKLNGVSVIVCTYNGAERLPETIRHIAKQKVNPNILWEVILVDNASTDNSKQAVISEWSKHKCSAKLRIVDQPTPGKQLALEKGYEVAKYEYWVTCDDDNWLDENFVQLVYEIMSGNEQIGALGGPNTALCEVEPPDWFKYFKKDYAAGEQGDIYTGEVAYGDITWKRGFVWGAGMIVRRTAWENLIASGFRTSMSCRKGTELSSGGDSEACYALVLAGWQIWYDKRLTLVHCMPGGRLSWDYLVRLFRGYGIASVGLELYEKAIKLARVDLKTEEIEKQDWWYEVKRTIRELRKYGIRKILSLRHPQDDNTQILMLEFYITRLKELIRVRNEYDRRFNELKNASWKKSYSDLKLSHAKFLQSENDFRYGWPWDDVLSERAKNPGDAKYPKISVLTPSYNSECTIEKAILSVLKQGYPNFEHIITDACSKDGTAEIAAKYPHLKFISEPDKGQSDAMNKAFRLSDGEIIVYLNADDYFQRDAFFKVADAFEKNPEGEMIVSNLFFEYADHTFTRNAEIEYKKIMLPFLYMFPINPVSYFYKRNVQEEIGPFPLDNHFTMDYWFLLKAYQKHRLVKIEDYLGTFFMNGYNKTSNADNRKNTHHRVLYHCWHYDRGMLPYYLYNYYKFFYYDKKSYNHRNVYNKLRKNLSRIYSILTLRKNKYYAERFYEKSKTNFYLKKRIRSLLNVTLSFAIYPKSVAQRSRWRILVPSLIGNRLHEKGMVGYRFFAYPPGMPLAHKLNYYGTEFKNANKSIKGNLLHFVTYIIAPSYLFKNEGERKHKSEMTFRRFLSYLNPVNWFKRTVNYFRNKQYKEDSYNFFENAKSNYYFHKDFQALISISYSFLVYPVSLRKRSRQHMLAHIVFGVALLEKLRFAYHMYRDNPDLTLPHKLNYYGNQLRKDNRTLKGNAVLIAAYLMSPKYILKREKLEKSSVIFASEFVIPKKGMTTSIEEVAGFRKSFRKRKPSDLKLKTRIYNANLRSQYRLKSVYHYFRYRKFKARSKELYAEAIERFGNDEHTRVVGLLVKSYLLYPLSLKNRNKLGIFVNSVLRRKRKK